ncbi:MAG TPA: cytochrome c [Kofleriaceae bacterium]|nr:cytochrome c [Kofleriaceae bacterium]
MSPRSLLAVLAGALVATVAAVGCGGDDPLFGPPTESTCPPTQTLSYDNFGKPFMEAYCTRCHSSELVGPARMGAPSFHDFDSLFGIKAVSEHIDETTAYGPAAENDSMPPDGAKPTRDERLKLGEWIACGMPETLPAPAAR